MGDSSGSPRVLHVFRAPLGGLFRHVRDLAEAQVERGLAVGLFCDATTGDPVTEAALARLAPRLALGLHRVPISRQPGIGDVAAIAALARVRRRTGATVLHAHGAKGGAYARLLPLPRGETVARLYTPHGGSFLYRPGSIAHRVYMGVERVLAARTETILFESAYVAERFAQAVGRDAAHGLVVPNGLADADFTPIDPARADFDLVFLGELRPAKGIDVLLEALALVGRDGGRRPSLLAVGSGPDRASLEARAEALGVAAQVRFESARPAREALGRGRVMVVPSRAESFPYVVLEAAAARQPLVATRVGGIPEIFGPAADRLVAPNDAPALARALQAALDASDDARASAAAALSDHVRAAFHLDGMVAAVLAAYDDALARAARPRTSPNPSGQRSATRSRTASALGVTAAAAAVASVDGGSAGDALSLLTSVEVAEGLASPVDAHPSADEASHRPRS